MTISPCRISNGSLGSASHYRNRARGARRGSSQVRCLRYASKMSMARNDHDVTLDLMENIACHTVDKQVQDRAPAFCAGNHQINIVIVDIFSQLPRWIALQRDDLNLASSACHQRLIQGVSGSLGDIF